MSNTYGAPPSNPLQPAAMGGSLNDLVSTQKGGVVNLSQIAGILASVMTATFGATIGTTNSPKVTVLTNVGTSSLLAIAVNSARIGGIMFHSPNPAAVNMWVVPSTITAVAGQGILVLPGERVGPYPSTCGWNAIATSGAANVLTVVEFV